MSNSTPEQVEYILLSLSSYEPSDIDGDEFEVAWENAAGMEGFCAHSVVETAWSAAKLIEQLKAERDGLLVELESYKQGKVHPRMKAGCAGEFEVSVETVCPHCYAGEPDEDCEVCHGAVEYTIRHVVPWDTQKEIFRAMCKFKAEGDQA